MKQKAFLFYSDKFGFYNEKMGENQEKRGNKMERHLRMSVSDKVNLP